MWLPNLPKDWADTIRFEFPNPSPFQRIINDALSRGDLEESPYDVWGFAYSRDKAPHYVTISLDEAALEFGVGELEAEIATITRKVAERVIGELTDLDSCFGIVNFLFPQESFNSYLIPKTSLFAEHHAVLKKPEIDFVPVGIRYTAMRGMADLIVDRSGASNLMIRFRLPVLFAQNMTFAKFWDLAKSMASLITTPNEQSDEASSA
jgi:hypothetical protein